MRLLPSIWLALCLSGCSWFSWGADDEEATLPPSKPSRSTPVDAYADAADRVMEQAAASVTVAREANAAGKVTVVEGELGVASSLLPRPSPAQLKEARSRAAADNQTIYAEAIVRADRLQRELDTLWGAVEAEKEKARSALAAKQQELDAARAAQRDLLWTGAGLLVIMLGVAGMVWGTALGVSKPEAALVLLCGAGIGSLPWLLESDLSVWVLAPVATLIGLRGVVWVWSAGWKKKA